MIYATVNVTIGDYQSTCDSTIVLYRGDKNVEIRFVLKGNKFTVLNSTYAQMIITRPSTTSVFSEIASIQNDTVILTISEGMIDELIEVGCYDMQIRLYDDSMKSRVTIPPAEKAIEVREPIAIDESFVDTAMVGYARAQTDSEDEEDKRFDENGNYIKTYWEHGDIITAGKLNKVEDSLEAINANDIQNHIEVNEKIDALVESIDAAEYVTETELNAKGYLTEHQDISGLATKEYVDEKLEDIDISSGVSVGPDEPTDNSSVWIDTDEEEYIEFADLNELKIVTPQMFGAKADGVTDDSEAIRQAIAALPKDGGTLYFPPGIYIHGDGTTTGLSYQEDTNYPIGHPYYPAILGGNAGIGRDIRFIFENYTNLTIKGEGAIIQSHEKNGEARNNSFFRFKNCKNVLIEGITIDGKRRERGIRFSDYGSGGDFTRCNLNFNRCKRVNIKNVISKGSMMDGMSLSLGSQTDFNEDFLIENCKFLDNHRQGISIEGATNVTVRDTECSLNGTGDGIMPKSGIDIEAYGDVNEYEHYSFNYNILIDNCYFDSNGYQNIAVNNKSFNTVIQNCTFKNAWVNTQANNEAKLLNCRLENCNLSNGFKRIAYNTIIYNKGGFLINSIDVSSTSAPIIEHNTFDLTPTSETFNTHDHNAIRLTGKEVFRNNYVKNAATLLTSDYNGFHGTCSEVVGNHFELTATSFNGIDIKDHLFLKGTSSRNKIKDNKYDGYVLIYSSSFNNYYKSDDSIIKSYNSGHLSTSKVCALLDYKGMIKITVRYLNQIEELLVCKNANYGYHHVISRNTDLGNTQLVTLYKDNNKNWYLKYTYTNTNTIMECSYNYADTLVDGLEYEAWLTVSDVSISSLTKINHVDITQLTASLKSNYDTAYTHSKTTHAPSNAQKNSDITKAEIEAKLTGTISSHSHDGIGDYVQNNWGPENVGMVLMVGSDGRVALYNLADYNPNGAWFKVTQNLTNVLSDYYKTEAKENMPLTMTLVTTNGKSMGTVTVIMNDIDVTSMVYSNSKVSIPAVNGDIIITAKALLYTNLVEPNDDNTTDTTIWVNGKKYNTAGNIVDDAVYVTTNYISVKKGDIVRIKGFVLGAEGRNVFSAAFYSDKKHYFTQALNHMTNNGFFKNFSVDTDNNVAQFTSAIDTVAYFRFSGPPINGNENVIITVNEEIVD